MAERDMAERSAALSVMTADLRDLVREAAQGCPLPELRHFLTVIARGLSMVATEAARMEQHLDQIVADAVAEERARFAMLQRSEIVKIN